MIYQYLGDPAKLRTLLQERRVDTFAWTDKEWLKAPATRSDPDDPELSGVLL